ncbi:MAG: glycosyltransferase family 39 protein [Desulfobacterales bacterium]
MAAAVEKSQNRIAWALIAGFALLRLFYAHSLPLAADEANYWQWGRHLAWGYHDQAPMIGWLIRLFTEIFGTTEVAVRLPSVAAMTVASVYMVLIARRWFGERAGLAAAVLSQAVFEFYLGGLLATPDGIQAAAWAGAAYHVGRAYEKDRWAQWLLAGAWFGFGMLSKFTMVLFLPGAYLFGLLRPDLRSRLAGFKPYAGVLLGLAMFSPVIAWNAAHDWNAFRHVAHLGGVDRGFALHLNYLGDYLAAQAGLLSPLVFVLVLWAWALSVQPARIRENPYFLYLFLVSFPVFAGFALLSLHSRVYGNWPGAGYVPAAVLAAALFGGDRKKTGKKPDFGSRLWPWSVASAYLISGVILLQGLYPVLPIPVKWDLIARETEGWGVLGREAAKLKAAMPAPEKTFLFAFRYQEASQLAFYTPGHPETVSINRWERPNVYDYWWRDEDLIGRDAVGVSYSPDSHRTRLNQIFERVDPPQIIRVFRRPPLLGAGKEPPVKVFYLYRAYGFKGGLRWVPAGVDDIRTGKQSPLPGSRFPAANGKTGIS